MVESVQALVCLCLQSKVSWCFGTLVLSGALFCVGQVKKVVGVETPERSVVVDGLVCRKNVAHRRMRTTIRQPRIMMLASTLEYQRTANKLSFFDTLLDSVRVFSGL